MNVKFYQRRITIIAYIALSLVIMHTYALFDGKISSAFIAAAIIKDPIIEMNNSYPACKNLPISPDTGKCPRAHQGLFNELVDCLEQDESGDQIKIACPSVAYGFDQETGKKLNTFWTYKKHILPVKELTADMEKTVPHPEYGQEPTIVILYPWQEFSVGTRFVHLPEHDTSNSYAVARADYATGQTGVDFVAHEHAMAEIKQDSQSTRTLFLKIVNDLIDRVSSSGPEHVIPYVWGGSSYLQPYKQPDFYAKDGTWHRSGNNAPYTGYDCSEFTMRMAQIAGIPFQGKTCAAIRKIQRELQEHDQLEEGDLIWVPGHIMIITAIERNELIEARGYGDGYGCIHRITLDKCFDGIQTYADLLEHHRNNTHVKFKNKQGIASDRTREVKLLKLMD